MHHYFIILTALTIHFCTFVCIDRSTVSDLLYFILLEILFIWIR